MFQLKAGGRWRSPRAYILRTLRSDSGHKVNNLVQASKVLECQGVLRQTELSAEYIRESRERVKFMMEFN